MAQCRSTLVIRFWNIFKFVSVIAISVQFGGASAFAPAAQDINASNRPLLLAFEEPFVKTAATSTDEDNALLFANNAYRSQNVPDNFQAFDTFLSNYPYSGWRVALLTNFGLSYYHYGHFSKAIDAWEQAWQTGKSVTEPTAKALVDRAVGELVRMHARLGHADRLAVILKEIRDRPVTGAATEAVTGANEGLWMMKNEPGVAYLCGPMALKNLLLWRGATVEQVQFLDLYRSGPQGVTLAEVSQLADDAKLDHRLIFREANKVIPVPSIVHWNVSHFAAIVSEADGRFHVIDPTFGQDLWVTRAAVESESSGYFLVPATRGVEDWREVSVAEASQVRGMGYTGNNDPTSTTPDDVKTKCCRPRDRSTNLPGKGSPSRPDCNSGMCGYNMHEMVVSLNLTDTPVGYAPPKGPPVYVTLTYNQREASQPGNFSFFNVSPKWNLNWLSYIQDDPGAPLGAVVRHVAGGGTITYSGFNSSSGAFRPDTRDASVLTRTTNPITYKRSLSDGSVELYAQSDGATTSPRRVFLKQVTDPSGNAVTLNYDNQLRLTSLTDATSRNTIFSYGLPNRPLLITRITDPFGRTADIDYDSNGRLSVITDVLGLKSKFAYNASSWVDTMTTPYGVTQFAFGETTELVDPANDIYGPYRSIEITDPLGFKERLEYRQNQLNTPGVPYKDPDGPAGSPIGVRSIIPKGIVAPRNRELYITT